MKCVGFCLVSQQIEITSFKIRERGEKGLEELEGGGVNNGQLVEMII